MDMDPHLVYRANCKQQWFLNLYVGNFSQWIWSTHGIKGRIALGRFGVPLRTESLGVWKKMRNPHPKVTMVQSKNDDDNHGKSWKIVNSWRCLDRFRNPNVGVPHDFTLLWHRILQQHWSRLEVVGGQPREKRRQTRLKTRWSMLESLESDDLF